MGPPFMKLYVGDYLADTRHLTAEEHGAYLLLIMHLFRTGEIPASEKQKAEIASTTTRRWPRVRLTIERFFVPLPDGSWTHKRVQKESSEARLISQKRREYGSKGGLKKHENFVAKARNLPEQNSSYQISDIRKSPSDSLRARGKKLPPADISNENYNSALAHGMAAERVLPEYARFCDYCRSNGKAYKDIDAAWRNWVTSPYQTKGNGNGHAKQHPSDRALELADDMERAIERQADAARNSAGGGENAVSLLEWKRPA